jgi:flagellar M-ring protein FliF
MPDNPVQKYIVGARRYWAALPPARRIAVGTLGIFFVLSMSYLGYIGTGSDYVTVFVDQKPEDAAKIVAVLETQNIPYELAAGGSVIKVPSSQQHEARLVVASEGVPSGGVGYEIFDEPKFGMSVLEQEMNKRRALQGELRRTIVSLDEVDDARVHVVLPKKATFKEDDEDATASVVLSIRNGRTLSKDKVRGIVNLVAASIGGLDPSGVNIVDSAGNILAGPTDPTMAATLPRLEFQHGLEKSLERRIVKLLEPAVGLGNTRVQVSADVDFREIEQLEEVYDAERAVMRSEHTLEKRRVDENNAAAGVVGVQANINNVAPDEGGVANTNVVHIEKTINREIPMTRRKIKEGVGKTKRLAVAVLVNGTYERIENASGEMETKYTERTKEELATLESIVKAAVGFDAERGDQVVVRTMPFMEQPSGEAEGTFFLGPDVWRGIRYGLVLLLSVLLLLFLVRPMVKAVTAAVPADQFLPEPVGGPSDPMAEIAVQARERAGRNRGMAIAYARKEPRKTAQILRAWLLEDGPEVAALPELPVESGSASSVQRT